jgi:hypothetical protein
MQYEEKFGLRKNHTYNEVVAYIREDPDLIKFPDRSALFLRNHQVFGQIKDSLRTFDTAQADFLEYQRGDDAAPYEPPRPRPPQDIPMGDPPNAPDDDDDLEGPPDGYPRNWGDLLQPGPDPAQEGLANEGMQPPPPPPPGPLQQMMQGAGNAFASAAGGTVGAAAGEGLVSAVGAALSAGASGAATGAATGVEAGPMGGLIGGIVGGVGGMLGAQAAQAASNAFSAPTPSAPPPDTQMGLRNSALNVSQQQLDNQSRAHRQGRAPPALMDLRTLNGLNHMKPRDRKPKRMANVQEGGSSGSNDPFMPRAEPAGIGVPVVNPSAIPASAPPAPAAPPSYGDLIGQIKSAPVIGSRPRERSPRRGDRRPLGVQRGESSKAWWQSASRATGMAGDSREEAMARRSSTIPSAESYTIDRNPKRKAETDLAQTRARPQPFPGGSRPRMGGTKRPAEDDPMPGQAKKPPPKPSGRMTSRPSGPSGGPRRGPGGGRSGRSGGALAA